MSSDATRREIPRNLSNNHRADIRRRIAEGERIEAEEVVQLLDGYDSLLDANMRLVLRSEKMEAALDSIIVRCEGGDPRTDWLPTIAEIARLNRG